MAPNALSLAFEWDPMLRDWDGVVCEADPPDSFIVEEVRHPMCLQWKTSHPAAIKKKLRHIKDLFADAEKQTPQGEMGAIYLAYLEGSRSELADERARQIIDEAQQHWWHEGGKVIPLVVVARLFAHAVGVGVPDLIENVLPLHTDPFFARTLPTTVFTMPRLRDAGIRTASR